MRNTGFLFRRFTLVVLLFTTLGARLFASDEDAFPPRPNPPQLVNNLSIEFPDFLSASEHANLEQKLVRFSDSTSNQIVVVIVDDLNGLDAEQYATGLGRKWGVGQADKRNGIVVLVKPTGGAGQRKLFIAVGYGLEGAIPDATAKNIVDREITPRFKSQDYYGGLNAATDVLMSLAKGEYDYKTYTKNKSSKNFSLLFIVLVVVFFLIGSKLRGRRGYSIGRRGMLYGTPFIGGGFGGGSSGGGGGFGGFGGGSFGGGGAGGSW